MIGSPASRGAIASTGAAGRGGFAEAPAVSIAVDASITIARGTQRRIARLECAVVNRIAIPCPGLKMPVRACVDRASAVFFELNHRQVKRFSHIRPPAPEEGRRAAEIVTRQGLTPSRPAP